MKHRRESASGEEVFRSSRHARLYLASFFFIHVSVLLVLPVFLYPTRSNLYWLAVLMFVMVPFYGLGIVGFRYLPRASRWIFKSEKPVYVAALDQAGLKGRRWFLAFTASRAALWVGLAIILFRIQELVG